MGFCITLQSDNHTFIAEAGETILEAALNLGHKLQLGCGGVRPPYLFSFNIYIDTIFGEIMEAGIGLF